MSNEKFKVKFGLAVGDTAATIDGTTGDIATNGDITVGGNDIKSNGGTTAITLNGTNVTTAGDLTVGGNDIKTSDGTLALTFTNVTGDVSVNGDLNVTGGDLTTGAATGNLFNTNATVVNVGNAATTEVNLGNTASGRVQIKSPSIEGFNTTQNVFNTTATTVNAFGAATTISIGANTGTTTINNDLVADSISVGGNLIATKGVYAKGTMDATFTDGIVVDYATGNGRISTGTADTLTFYNGGVANTQLGQFATNGDFSITGDLTVNGNDIKSNGGQTALTIIASNALTNNSVIRNATTQAAGDIWTFGPGGTGYRGWSVDNSAATTKGPGSVIRSFSGGAVNGNATRGRVIFEKARGTSASPTAVQAGDQIGSVEATGYTSTGWVEDLVPAVTGVGVFTASENWVSNTNLGTNYGVSLAPTGTTITTGASLIPVQNINPQGASYRSDTFAFGKGKTSAFVATGSSISGTTLTIGTVTSGTVAVGQLLTGANISVFGLYIVSNISGSGSGSTWVVSQSTTAASGTIVGNAGFVGSDGTTLDALADLKLLTNNIKASNGNTNITLTSNTLASFAGDIKIGGNDIQNSGGTNAISLSASNATTTIKGDTLILESDAGTDYFNATSTGLTNLSATGHFNFTAPFAHFNKSSSASAGIINYPGGQSDNSFSETIATTNTTDATQYSSYGFTTRNTTDGINYTPTVNNQRLGWFKFNGNAYTSTSPGVPGGPTATFYCEANENWTNTANGSRFVVEVLKQGTITPVQVLTADAVNSNIKADNLIIYDSVNNQRVIINSTTLQTKLPLAISGSVSGNVVLQAPAVAGTQNYTLPSAVPTASGQILTSTTGGTMSWQNLNQVSAVYGQWQWDATVTPAATNTAYVFPIQGASGVVDYANIASVASTSHIIPGALGKFKLQFSVQINNADNGTEHTAYIWWRKNGTDITGSMGRVTVPKGGATISGWDNIVDVTNVNDYYELAYAVDNTNLTFPYFASTAFGPSTACLFITLVSVGA